MILAGNGMAISIGIITRLKLSLDGRSPFEYRRHLGLAASFVHLSVRPLLPAVGEGFPETKYQRSTVHLYIFFFV